MENIYIYFKHIKNDDLFQRDQFYNDNDNDNNSTKEFKYIRNTLPDNTMFDKFMFCDVNISCDEFGISINNQYINLLSKHYLIYYSICLLLRNREIHSLTEHMMYLNKEKISKNSIIDCVDSFDKLGKIPIPFKNTIKGNLDLMEKHIVERYENYNLIKNNFQYSLQINNQVIDIIDTSITSITSLKLDDTIQIVYIENNVLFVCSYIQRKNQTLNDVDIEQIELYKRNLVNKKKNIITDKTINLYSIFPEEFFLGNHIKLISRNLLYISNMFGHYYIFDILTNEIKSKSSWHGCSFEFRNDEIRINRYGNQINHKNLNENNYENQEAIVSYILWCQGKSQIENISRVSRIHIFLERLYKNSWLMLFNKVELINKTKKSNNYRKIWNILQNKNTSNDRIADIYFPSFIDEITIEHSVLWVMCLYGIDSLNYKEKEMNFSKTIEKSTLQIIMWNKIKCKLKKHLCDIFSKSYKYQNILTKDVLDGVKDPRNILYNKDDKILSLILHSTYYKNYNDKCKCFYLNHFLDDQKYIEDIYKEFGVNNTTHNELFLTKDEDQSVYDYLLINESVDPYLYMSFITYGHNKKYINQFFSGDEQFVISYTVNTFFKNNISRLFDENGEIEKAIKEKIINCFLEILIDNKFRTKKKDTNLEKIFFASHNIFLNERFNIEKEINGFSFKEKLYYEIKLKENIRKEGRLFDMNKVYIMNENNDLENEKYYTFSLYAWMSYISVKYYLENDDPCIELIKYIIVKYTRLTNKLNFINFMSGIHFESIVSFLQTKNKKYLEKIQNEKYNIDCWDKKCDKVYVRILNLMHFNGIEYDFTVYRRNLYKKWEIDIEHIVFVSLCFSCILYLEYFTDKKIKMSKLLRDYFQISKLYNVNLNSIRKSNTNATINLCYLLLKCFCQ